MIIINNDFDSLPEELKASMLAVAEMMGALITKRMLDVDAALKPLLDKPEEERTNAEESQIGGARMACLQGIHKGLSLHIGQVEMMLSMMLSDDERTELTPMLRVDNLTHVHKGQVIERNRLVEEHMMDSEFEYVLRAQASVETLTPVTQVDMSKHKHVKEMVQALGEGVRQ